MNAPVNVLAVELTPARDAEGWMEHPGIQQLLEDGEDGAELPIDLEKVRGAGYEACFGLMDDELDDSHPAWVAYFEAGEGTCALWEPEPPEGLGWRLVATYDTDDGPAAMFVRPVGDRGVLQ